MANKFTERRPKRAYFKVFFSSIESKQDLLRTDVDKIRTDVEQLPQTVRLIVREELQFTTKQKTDKESFKTGI